MMSGFAGAASSAAQFQFDAARYSTASVGRAAADQTRLSEVAHEFESLFIGQMLDAMRDTLNPENRLIDTGMGGEIFEDMLYDEYASIMSQTGGLGLAEMIISQYQDRV